MIDHLLDTMNEDRILFLSGGPESHLSRRSMFAKGMKMRVVVTQPHIEQQLTHSPLNGETKLYTQKKPIEAVLQNKNDGLWETSHLLNANGIDELFRMLKDHTPRSSVWAGALAYDLVQWTQPLALQHPPNPGEILAVLWQIDEWEECDVIIPEPPMPFRIEGETTSHTDNEHAEIVRRVKNSITSGELYQLNFGRTWSGPLGEDPAIIFNRLAISNPAPFSGFIQAEDLGLALVSSSPEILLETKGDEVMTAPIKGTRPRGSDTDQESLLRRDLVHDLKERAEHRMLVDLERNELSLVCEHGTVKQSRFDVEAYANVQHLVSQVTGKLSNDKDGLDAIQALFPGGSITGCPKTVVCAAIDELEGKPRSFWTGSMGWVNVHNGEGTWNIMIRTLEARKCDNKWKGTVMAGGGITIESIPEAEVAESIWKAAALRRACGWLTPETTMLPKGELGIYPLYLEQNDWKPEARFSIHVAFIDNLDSFSYNIVHALKQFGCSVEVIDGRGPIVDLKHDAVIIGPGPGRPEISPISMYATTLSQPILGICLGHQAIGIRHGMELIESPLGPVHGVPCEIVADGTGLMKEGSATMTRYNSLVLSGKGDVEISGWDETGTLPMEIHTGNSYGIQFHPESIGSPSGLKIIAEFLRRVAHS
ncbi:MAG: chorismate-binding protein [Candidatus Poseidoniaceae archaeon]|nr:chorismate-binding protein [Candidatus Poseidoniaceae archaeon]